jgi:hypothetical protein
MVNTLVNNDNNKNAVSSSPTQLAVSSIEQLPDELLLHIFSFLQASDLLKVELTCHQWKNLAEEEILWKSLYQQYFKMIEPVVKLTKKTIFVCLKLTINGEKWMNCLRALKRMN